MRSNRLSHMNTTMHRLEGSPGSPIICQLWSNTKQHQAPRPGMSRDCSMPSISRATSLDPVLNWACDACDATGTGFYGTSTSVTSDSDDTLSGHWLGHVQISRGRGAPPPSCFIHPDVERKANQKDRPLRYREIAPPAMNLLYHTALLSVLGPTLIFILAYSRSSCDHGMDYPVPYWIWLCAAPFVVCHFIYEVRVFRYTTIPYFQVVGRFQMLTIHLGFHLWFLISAGKSLAFQGAVFSNAVFAAKTFATASCPITYTADSGFQRETSFNEIWETTLHQSTFAFWMREIPLSAQVLFFGSSHSHLSSTLCWSQYQRINGRGRSILHLKLTTYQLNTPTFWVADSQWATRSCCLAAGWVCF